MGLDIIGFFVDAFVLGSENFGAEVSSIAEFLNHREASG